MLLPDAPEGHPEHDQQRGATPGQHLGHAADPMEFKCAGDLIHADQWIRDPGAWGNGTRGLGFTRDPRGLHRAALFPCCSRPQRRTQPLVQGQRLEPGQSSFPGGRRKLVPLSKTLNGPATTQPGP